jgi:hypothetical protein
MHTQNHGTSRHNHHRIRLPKHNPQSNPSHEKSHIHGVAHVPVKPNHHQPLRRSQGHGRPAASPPEIPDTPASHRKPQHRRDRRQPTPARVSRMRHLKTQPRRQQPKPKRKKRASNQQGSDRRKPRRSRRGLLRRNHGGRRHKLTSRSAEYASKPPPCKATGRHSTASQPAEKLRSLGGGGFQPPRNSCATSRASAPEDP